MFSNYGSISIHFHEILYFCYRDHLTDDQYPDFSLLLLLCPLLLSFCEQPTASVVDNSCGLLLVLWTLADKFQLYYKPVRTCGHDAVLSLHSDIADKFQLYYKPVWTCGHDATFIQFRMVMVICGQVPVSDSLQFGLCGQVYLFYTTVPFSFHDWNVF